ncbi:MAG: recombinase family protein [Sandaracinus sp.]
MSRQRPDPIRWAIYARKSTEEQLASTEVQIREARAAIANRGGVVDDAHVYVDDAKSRAEFKNRPALWRMMAAAGEQRFDAVMVRDETRLGGDMHRTGLLMQDLVETGARLYFYSTGEEVRLDSPTQKLIATIRNFGSEVEREKISSRVYEHLRGKAASAYNAGGAVYGYSNRPVMIAGPDGKPTKLRTEYAVDEVEAAVVRRVFELYAGGLGLRGIARTLNGDRVASPKAGRRGTGSWSPSTIRSIVVNPRYRGFVPWNRTQKTYRGGTKVRVKRDPVDWMLVAAPELRIVSDELWAAANARRPGRALATGGKRVGRPPMFLLSGILRCGECGGSIQVVGTKASHETVRAYACSYHRNRGPEACSNARRRPMADVDAAVTQFLADELRHHGLLEELMGVIRRRLTERIQKPRPTDRRSLEGQADTLRAEIGRLTDALAAAGGQLDPILDAIRQRQAKLSEVEQQLAALPRQDGPAPISLQLKRAEREMRERVENIEQLLAADGPAGRAVIAALFPEGLKAYPTVDADDRKRWRIEGTAVFGPASFQDAGGVTNRASPGGFEPP